MFELIYFIFLCGYFIQTVLLIIGSSRKFPKLKSNQLPNATIIAAARNEEENILDCLTSLDNLEYPEGKLEIIIVDDKSTDKTGEIIDEFICDKPRFKKIVTKKEIGILKGKTNALANAIEISTGDVILTTDADCTFPSTWAKTLASYFTDDVGVVNGFTTQKAYNQFSGMQSIDFIYLLMAAAGTINLGHPISCIGNNMSYRKKAYREVGGYEKLPFSVTEDFQLLNSIYKTKKYKIILPLDSDSLVTTKPLPDFKSLYRQKKRWGVGGLGVPIRGYFVMLFGFITNLAVILTPFFFTKEWLIYSIFKIFIDYLAMYSIHSQLGIKKNLKYFPVYELYFLFYVVALPFSIGFNRRVIWKGREY